MAVDEKNANRIDLNEMYLSCQRQSVLAIKALGKLSEIHSEDYAIQETDFETVHPFAMEGMAVLADDTHRVKYFTQTGIDALTHYGDLENPKAAASYSDPDLDTVGGETIVDPDSATIEVVDISGAQFTPGEKLEAGTQDTITFTLDSFPDPSSETPNDRSVTRYTIVQQFIKSAIEYYILMKWFKLHSLHELSSVNEEEFEKLKNKIRHNSTSQQNYEDTIIPQSNFYG